MSYDRTNEDYEARIASDAAAGFPMPAPAATPKPPPPKAGPGYFTNAQGEWEEIAPGTGPKPARKARTLDKDKIARRKDITDLTGQRFGMLLVLCLAPKPPETDSAGQRKVLWTTRCDCGSEQPIRADLMRYGLKTHCGCSRKERAPNRAKPGEEQRPKGYVKPRKGSAAAADSADPAEKKPDPAEPPEPPPRRRMSMHEAETLTGQQMAARGEKWSTIAEYFSYGTKTYSATEAQHRCESTPALKPLTHPKHS